jgi:hypothetical protein
MNGRIVAVMLGCLAVAGCSDETDSTQPPPSPPPPPAASAETLVLDPVLSAAMQSALEREADAPSEARSIYTAIVEKHPAVWCDGGPIAYFCADEARARLRVMACRDARRAPVTASSSAALAETIAAALRANDAASLESHAACDFMYGPCESDAGTSDVPDFVLACLPRVVGRSVQLASTREDDERRAAIALTSTPVLHLLLTRPDATAPWTWNGVCFSPDDDPCASQ